ncbi:2-dehydropantoate 2-reductase [Nannocystis exedens]|nr:2-dehydropantoate 2-reductase [Nannocystis exedens]
MKIAVIGPGGIGSTFASQLARAGHEVTVVARTKRLAQLQRDGAIVTAKGERAAVQVSAALDPSVAYELVLVTVLASQVDAVLPALRASAAKSVMFMFNTKQALIQHLVPNSGLLPEFAISLPRASSRAWRGVNLRHQAAGLGRSTNDQGPTTLSARDQVAGGPRRGRPGRGAAGWLAGHA